ncbi:ferritin [Sediminispirochaeta bajacaliforniensis]|uniref:ferritin n=1 Tax=Sediminispirochaeta bajacaliforniensis TaxID=148 RepID=UPI00038150C9|nr:ferritin [Sediminispirochaeta bajacaliforniensis]
MIQEKMEAALNKQIAEELGSAYLYQAMSADFAAKNRLGMAAWMQAQAGEEMEHARKIYHYILGRGGRIELMALAAPQQSWESPLAVFKASYKHEQHISACIHDLVKLARELDDTATEVFLSWFVTEQVEEEASVDEVVQKLNQLGDAPHALYMLDKELGARQA